jgi:hypothetical protein
LVRFRCVFTHGIPLSVWIRETLHPHMKIVT